ARLSVHPELQSTLQRCFRKRFLAPLAYHAGLLVPGLCLYPAGRKPAWDEAPDFQSGLCMSAHRYLAWKRPELHSLGACSGRTHHPGKADLRKMAEKDISAFPYLCDCGHSAHMDDFCHYGSE